MGTFTKAFGSVGGYISGNPVKKKTSQLLSFLSFFFDNQPKKKDLIEYLKFRSFGTIYSTSMSPACAQQALSALRVIMGKDGTTDGLRRLKALHENSNYFRRRLLEEGFHVFGDKDSPVVLLMLYNPAMMISLSRRLLQHGVRTQIHNFFFFCQAKKKKPFLPLQDCYCYCWFSCYSFTSLSSSFLLILWSHN